MREGRIISAAVADDMGNPDFDTSGYRVLIMRLSPFRDIEVSYAHLVLFDEARRALPDAFIDFAFLPPAQDRRALTARRAPWFFGRASGRAPSEFNLILVSCAFTLELANLAWLFTQSRLPLSRAVRLDNPGVPLIVLGGSSAVTAGSLVVIEDSETLDSMVDGIFFGEGEGAIEEVVKIAAEGAAERRPKRETLARIAAAAPGFWPCENGCRAVRALPRRRPAVLSAPLTLNGENADHAKLAITAGCTGHCAFCLEGWDRRPFREQNLGDISASALALKKSTGATDVELFSYNFNMHHSAESIIPAVGRYFQHVSLMSQRIDVLARSPTMLSAEIAAGKRSFTLGIEGVSERLRRYYRKGITLDDIHASCRGILEHDARELKLFYIISGVENERDLSEFSEFLRALTSMKRDARAHTRIILSAGYLVRLPFTPLQFAALAPDRESLASIARTIEAACDDAALEFRLAASYDDYWADQLLSLAGPDAAAWLRSCPDRGYVYDTRMPRGATASLESTLRSSVNLADLLAEKPASYRPAFSFIEEESHWQLLRALYERSKEALGDIGLGASSHQKHSAVNPQLAPRASNELSRRAVATIEAQEAAKARFSSVVVRVIETEMIAFSTPQYERAWLIRTLAALVPNSERAILDCRPLLPDDRWGEMLSGAGDNARGLFGVKYFALYGPDAGTIERAVIKAGEALAGRRADPAFAPRSASALSEIACVREAPPAQYCTLRFIARGLGAEAFRAAASSWLDRGGIKFTVNSFDNKGYFSVSESSKTKKSVQSIQYHTSSSELVAELKVGPKVDLGALVSPLSAASGMEDILLSVLRWE